MMERRLHESEEREVKYRANWLLQGMGAHKSNFKASSEPIEHQQIIMSSADVT